MSATAWHNPLPAWIFADLRQRPLRQGPRTTLQTIANKCDAPPRDRQGNVIGSGTLLGCFGGQNLIDACGCRKAAFWTHLNDLMQRGYVVPLSKGGGRLASVYGVPGKQGELDPFRAERRDKARRWTRKDTAKIRQLLVSGNQTLADGEPGNGQVSENKTPAVRKPNRYCPETGRLPSESRTLPSPIPSSSTSAPKPSPAAGTDQIARLHDDDGPAHPDDTVEAELAVKLPDTANSEQIKALLVEYGVDGGRAHKLAARAIPAVVREALARALPRLPNIGNPGGYIGDLVKDAIERDRKARAQQHAEQWAKSEADLQAAYEQISKMPDQDFTATLRQFAEESPDANVVAIVQQHLDGQDPIAARRDPVVKRHLAEHVSRMQDDAA